jgi:hypothetical protein
MKLSSELLPLLHRPNIPICGLFSLPAVCPTAGFVSVVCVMTSAKLAIFFREYYSLIEALRAYSIIE